MRSVSNCIAQGYSKPLHVGICGNLNQNDGKSTCLLMAC